MEKVAVNEFVRRQIKGSGKTYSDSLSFDAMAKDAEKQMDNGNYKEGYREGVRIIRGSKKYTNHFICPYVKINENTELISRVVKRQIGEIPYIHAIPEGVEKMPMGSITMMRNQLEFPGGTKAKYSSEEWAESVMFWQKYAALEN